MGEMIGKQGPGIDFEGLLFAKFSQSGNKIIPIIIIQEDFPLFYSSPHDMG
jgi:hypothetical protein